MSSPVDRTGVHVPPARPDLVQLRVLGAIDLRRADESTGPPGATTPLVITQPKPLALLAYLAVATPRGFQRRDTLVGLFWPELDQERARASLRKALHHLRREVGAEVLVNRGDDEVGLDPTRFWCDAAAFDAALAAGDAQGALALYRGDLLCGFYLTGESADFERWLDRERGRLRAQASRASWMLAEASERAGQSAEAAAWARRAVEHSDDEGAVRRAITLLDRLGDRAGALRVYEEFARRLRDELSAEPAAETTALVRAVRERARAHPHLVPPLLASTAEAAAPPPVRKDEPVADGASDVAARAPAPPNDVPVDAGPQPRGRRAWPERVPLAAASMTAVAVLIVAALFLVARGRIADRAATPAADASGAPPLAIAILAFRDVDGDTTDAYLDQGLREELSVRLGSLGRFRIKSGASVRRAATLGITDPAALGRSLGVQYLVDGTIRRAGARLRVSVHLVRASDGFQLWADDFDTSVGGGELLAFETDVAQRVATSVGGELTGAERALLTRVATSDSAAYDHYLRGNYYLGKRTPRTIDRAIAEYRTASRLDDRFVAPLARRAYAYGLITDWGWRDSLGTGAELLRHGLALADTALVRDSASADAWLARAYLLTLDDPGAMRGAVDAFEHSLALDSTNAEAYHQYGQALMALGRDADAERAYRRALALEPDRGMTLVPLAALALRAHRKDEAVRLSDSAVTVDPAAPYTYTVRATIREALGDTAGTRADAETALRVDSSYAVPAEAMLARALARGNPAAARSHLAAAIRAMRDAANPSPTDAMFVAPAADLVGQRELAVDLVERARPRGAYLWWYLTSPGFDRLRGDPRIRRVMDEAHAPAAAASATTG